MSFIKLQKLRGVHLLALAGFALLICGLLLLMVVGTPAPVINLEYGDTTIEISADRAWTLLPGDCVDILWQLEGIKSLYIEGYGRIGSGEMTFCPNINATSPLIEVTAQNGIYRLLALEIHHLPDMMFYLVGFIGLVGSILLAAYFLWAPDPNRPLPVSWIIIGALLLIIAGGWLRLRPASAPLIDEDNGNVAVRFWAENNSIIFPHECADVGWSVVGAQSIVYGGQVAAADDNPATAEHCAGDGEAATLEIIDSGGVRHTYTLSIASFFPYPQNPPVAVIWSLFGLILGLIVFVPIATQTILNKRSSSSTTDYIAVTGCLLFAIALYLPYGFDSIGHWENQIIHNYIEGGAPSFFDSWIVSRFFGLVNRILAYLISSESFIGYNIVNCLMLAGTTIVVYGIMRKFQVSPFYAFLIAVFFMAYPVNPMLLSLRSMLLNFSRLLLFVAVYLIIEFSRNPRRISLVGIWLALLYNVSSYESGYTLILVVPLLLWVTCRNMQCRMIKLTAIWYLAPAFKVAHLVLLIATDREFYQSGLLSGETQGMESLRDFVAIFFQKMGSVFTHTFIDSWREAFGSLDSNLQLGPIAIILTLVAGIVWYLARSSADASTPAKRQIGLSLLTGLMLIGPSVGVLIWFPLYANDLWRPYLYVPLGAAIAVFSLVLLVASPIRNLKHRHVVVTGVCLLLFLPAVSRLQLQLHNFVDSADKKARILHSIVEIAPSAEPTTQFLVTTPMDHDTLGRFGIFEFIDRDMINSALQVLYGNEAPERTYFCLLWRICGDQVGGETIFDANDPGKLLQRTLVFNLNEDLSVELVKDPAALLDLDIDVPYDASLLYDADAPLPPRAVTMLGAALGG